MGPKKTVIPKKELGKEIMLGKNMFGWKECWFEEKKTELYKFWWKKLSKNLGGKRNIVLVKNEFLLKMVLY